MTRFDSTRWVWLLIPLIAWLARAQGTFNASNNFIPAGESRKAFITDWNGTPISKSVGRVAILTPDLQYLSPAGEAGVSLSLDGLFFINNLVMPGVPTGGSATILVRAWDSSTGATYDQAWNKASTLVTITRLGGGTDPAATFAANSNFIGLQFGYYEPPPPPPPPFSYRLEGGLATITSSALRTNALVIPAAINGVTVARIAPLVFAGRPELVSVVFPSTLVEIGSGAFSGCRALTQVALPQGLLTLGDSAFESCSSLKSVELSPFLSSIPNRAFALCEALTAIALPERIQRIGDGAFKGCSRLSQLELPPALERLGDEALSGCTALTDLILPEGLRWIGARALRGCTGLAHLELPESLEEVRDEGFRDLKMTDLWIPAGLGRLGQNVFQGMDRLQAIDVDPANVTYRSVEGVLFTKSMQQLVCYPMARSGDFTIPSGISGIEPGAFAGRSKLTGIGIPATVTRIGASAFVGAPLVWADIPGSVTDLDDSAFAGCPLLRIAIPSGVRVLGPKAFANCVESRSVTLPTSLVQMGESAFAGCTGLTSVTIPGSLTDIPVQAFQGCSRLLALRFNNGVQIVGIQAFAGCQNLISIQWPDSLTEIRDQAFAGCARLAYVELPVSVIQLGEGVFRNNTELIRIVLPSRLERMDAGVFDGCAQLQSIYFAGKAPASGAPGLPAGAIVYHVPGLPGWGETWNGSPTREWLPVLEAAQGDSSDPGPRLTVNWSDGETVVLEGSGSLVAGNWQPLSTNRLERYSLQLTDPEGAAHGIRFYRVRAR